ncbi:universal stress protein [Flavobacterium sp. GT3R68]|uniref:universal stress protein n=1 Tax=Flavobacterium sp. GT3R68 TaxID=2594437 RepID=UPI000F87F2DA|nr:universal stress protein [Flavobacterium sp. GT3R68]RTY90589.1 universal stress protein [Flavobacterium sp. GSN2]TRW89885.1 universal stress protein [Flavobacterium sp. GT3R68]
MKKILFPTDFSETANNAFVYALQMAKFMDAEVICLHVYDLPPISYEGYPSYVAEVYETLELNKFENFKDHIPSLRKIAEENELGFIKMSHVLEQGDLVPAIEHLAESENIDLIVMGTNGVSGWKEKVFGSNTGAVIGKVPMPVLSVPVKSKFTEIKTIGFTTRFRNKDRAALQQVLEVAKKMKAQVKCLYVQTFDSDVKTAQIEKWRERYAAEPVEFFVVAHDDVQESIFEFLKSQKIDMLSMLTYKRSFLDGLFHTSMTKKLSYHCEIPILALHEPEIKKMKLLGSESEALKE